MVNALSGGIIAELFVKTAKQLSREAAKGLALKSVDRGLDLGEHAFGRFGRARGQGGHIHLVPIGHRAQLFHAQLKAAVVLQRASPNLDDRSRCRRRDVSVPDFGVYLARAVSQVHIQIFRAVSTCALVGCAYQQKALEALVFRKIANSLLCHA